MTKRTCGVSGCGRPYLAKAFCSAHYQRWKKTGDPGPSPVRDPGRPGCSLDGCERPHYGNGFCNPHWRRLKAHGTAGATEVAPRGQTERCTVEGCEDQHSAKGYCASHYTRWRRTGEVGDVFAVRRRDPQARDEHGRKQCRECDRWLVESSFHRKSNAGDGFTRECRDCQHARAILRRYGVDTDWYFETLERQGGGCAICGARPNGRRLHVDHDHSHCSSGKACAQCVRGLLCSSCNTGIGNFRDNVDLLKAAIGYLEVE